MMELTVFSPLPENLGFSRSSNTLVIPVPYQEGITVAQVIQLLAEQYPAFKKVQQERGLKGLMIAVNERVLESQARMQEPLAEDSRIMFFTQYTGG